MRKYLFTATILIPLAVAPAFAGSGPVGGIIAGDVSRSAANSTAGVASTQRTGANAIAAGNGGVIVGAVSGNYTQVQTTATGQARPHDTWTSTNAQQTNVGGTVTGGRAINAGTGKGASGMAGGSQDSQAAGNANAAASNMNVRGFAGMDQPRHRGGSR